MKIFSRLCTIIGTVIVFVVIPIVVCFLACQCLSMAFGPDYEKGKYTMTYKVYYPNNVREYTITNDYPIGMDSYKGTNSIYKITEDRIFVKTFYEDKVISTTAPIEIVNYTFIKDN